MYSRQLFEAQQMCSRVEDDLAIRCGGVLRVAATSPLRQRPGPTPPTLRFRMTSGPPKQRERTTPVLVEQQIVQPKPSPN